MTTCSTFKHLLIFVCSLGSCYGGLDGDLVAVVAIFRHGDRTPIQPYPTDPYRNRSFWPVDFGELTNLGKEQEYQLGLWLRNHYSTFLPLEYSEQDIRVVSTDVDRTLMSAEACLAGLYPPVGPQIWDQNLKWQPIPIHTTPEDDDVVLAMKKDCAKYDVLMKQLLKSDEFRAIYGKLHDLFAYLTKYTGMVVADFLKLEYVYNTLYIESVYNLTLPDWTKAVYPDKLQPWAAFSFAVDCYTPELARLRTGPLLHQIQQYFLKCTTDLRPAPKFQMYSAHDMTIANVLQSVGAFQYHNPPYASLILFELRKADSLYYINLLYKNSSEVQNLTVKGCIFDCPFDEFRRVLQPVTIDVKRWEKECNVGVMMQLTALSEIASILLLSCAGLIFVLILGVVVVIVRRRNIREDVYVRLPDTDVEA